MNTRPYRITLKTTGDERLVTASNQAQALRHVARDAFTISPASGNDVLELMQKGVKPEDASAEATETAPATEGSPE